MKKNQYLFSDDYDYVRGNIFHSSPSHNNTSFCVVTKSIHWVLFVSSFILEGSQCSANLVLQMSVLLQTGIYSPFTTFLKPYLYDRLTDQTVTGKMPAQRLSACYFSTVISQAWPKVSVQSKWSVIHHHMIKCHISLFGVDLMTGKWWEEWAVDNREGAKIESPS